MSFKSVLSMNFPEVGSEPEHLAEVSHDKSAPVSSLPQSTVPGAYNGLDLFSTPFAPQSVSSAPPTANNSQLPESSLPQSVNVIQQSPASSIPSFFEQQPLQILQPSSLDLFTSPSQQQSAASNNGWATFDMPENIVPVGTDNSALAAPPPSDGMVRGNSNPFSVDQSPFSIDQSSSYQDSVGHEPSASSFTFGLESRKTVETTSVSIVLLESAVGFPFSA